VLPAPGQRGEKTGDSGAQPWLATVTKNNRSSEDALAKLLRWSNFHIPLTWTMIAPLPSVEEYRAVKADIFFSPERGYLSIHASDKLMRSFLLSSCERIAVSDDALDFTLVDGIRHLLVEETSS
jgi:hypothetical protein